MKKIAIYSRKSKYTGKGDSIENQIEMCKEYISKFISEDVQFNIYEDEGFSGGNLDRPNFKKLIRDIKSNNIDILVCYRLDRISRNVSDFSSTLELLQAHNCAFISIKEQFDTTSPMGRAMIYISSVFAQLERETIAERVRDNMLEMAKNGKWTGGKIPVGFTSEKKKYIDDEGNMRQKSSLVQNKEELEFVKFLYQKYLELGSLHKLECYLSENNIKSKSGILFEKSTLKIILQNPIYVKADEDVIEYLQSNSWTVYGETDNNHSLLTYNKTKQAKLNGKNVKIKNDISERIAAVSSIPGYIESKLWLDVQKQFDKNRDTFPRLGKTHNAMLVGKLRCGKCNEYMLVQHGRVNKDGEKLFYYLCSLKRKSHGMLCNNNNAKAAELEKIVILILKNIGLNKKAYLESVKQHNDSILNEKDIEIEKSALLKEMEENKLKLDKALDILLSSNDSDATPILLEKIKILKRNENVIQDKLNNLEEKFKKAKIEKINIELIESLVDKCATIDSMSRDKQKELIDNLIDVIYWYGDGNHGGKIRIKFIGTDNQSDEIEINENSINKLLQNGVPTSCKAYDYLLSLRKTKKNKRLRTCKICRPLCR
ncbi:MAG: recombinase family protein [Clostridium sp.]